MPWDIWLIFLALGVIIPWRGRMRLRQLLSRPKVEGRERIALYLSTIAFQWVAVAVAGWRAAAHGYTSVQLGLTIPDKLQVGIGAIVGACILAGAHWLNLRRMGKSASKIPPRIRVLSERILPQSNRETVLFLVLAVTAGVCEEFLYRGFAMAALQNAALPIWSVVLLSALLFGLAHLYQGRGGFVGTMMLGILFGIIRIAYHSLVPAMVWHAAVDVAAGIAGPRYLLPGAAAGSTPQVIEP